MHAPSSPPAPSEPACLPAAAPAPTSGAASSRLSSNREMAVVQADYVALANDLEQAHALANSLELQLSGKCNELAQFKHLWERTRTDMQKFEHDLEALRKERHALANQAQIAMASEHRIEKLKRENEQLKGLAEQLKARTEQLDNELNAERIMRSDARRIAAELELQLAEAQRRAGQSSSHSSFDANLRGELETLRRQLDRILDQPVASQSRHLPAVSESIEISFVA